MNTFSIRTFVAAATLAFTSFATVAHAQSNKMTANVLFAFEYAGHAYTAGQYSFTATGNVVELDRKDQIQKTLAHRSSMDRTNTTEIVFDHTGSQYFLRQIVLARSGQRFTFLETKHEKQARLTVNVAGTVAPSATAVSVLAVE